MKPLYMKNKMYSLKFLSIGLLCFLFTFLEVQSQVYLSIDSAEAMALRNSKDVHIANQTYSKAVFEQHAARTNYLPKVSASATGLYLKNNYEKDVYLPTMYPNPTTGELYPNIVINPQTSQPVIGADGNPVFNMYAYLPLEISLQGAYLAGLYIEQPIYAGGKIKAGNAMANNGVQISKENIALQRNKTIVEVHQAYWLCVAVQSKLLLAQKHKDMLAVLLERVKNSYSAGYLQYNEMLKVQVEYDKAVLDVQKAKNGLQLSTMALCRIIGIDMHSSIQCNSSIPIETVVALAGEESVQNRPEYSILLHKIAYEQEQLKMIRADYLPSIGLRAGYTYVGGVEINSQEYSNSNTQVMLSVQIPLFAWTQGKQKLSSAIADIKIQELEFEKNTKLMMLELEQAKVQVTQSFSYIQIAENALVQAQENLRVVTDKYEVGTMSLSDVLVAQTLWQQSSASVIQAKIEYAMSALQYKKLIGDM